ncbi:hypothetical protein L539_4622 [Bordetella hinzii 5132]|nr:hypothetical protein L539_4622 [Bordetella hinzii 5132]
MEKIEVHEAPIGISNTFDPYKEFVNASLTAENALHRRPAPLAP